MMHGTYNVKNNLIVVVFKTFFLQIPHGNAKNFFEIYRQFENALLKISTTHALYFFCEVPLQLLVSNCPFYFHTASTVSWSWRCILLWNIGKFVLDYTMSLPEGSSLLTHCRQNPKPHVPCNCQYYYTVYNILCWQLFVWQMGVFSESDEVNYSISLRGMKSCGNWYQTILWNFNSWNARLHVMDLITAIS